MTNRCGVPQDPWRFVRCLAPALVLQAPVQEPNWVYVSLWVTEKRVPKKKHPPEKKKTKKQKNKKSAPMCLPLLGVCQAAARVWRDGQKKRVFVYRFLAAGTIEGKVRPHATCTAP